jgi:hypothetical protein
MIADHIEHIRRKGTGDPQLLLLLGRFQSDLCGAQHGVFQGCLKHCSGWNFMV